jgi:hypothetical protein
MKKHFRHTEPREIWPILAPIIGGALGAAGTIGSAFINAGTQEKINEANISAQSDANAQNIAFQREQNEITRQREDNSIQRRVADLKAAGLNPVLAAGQGAASAPMTAPRAEAARSEASKINEAAIGASLRNAIIDSLKQKAELDNIKAATQKAKAEAGAIESKTQAEVDEIKARTTESGARTSESGARTSAIEIENRIKTSQAIYANEHNRLIVEGQNLTNEGLRLVNQYNRATMPDRIREQTQKVKLMYQHEKSQDIENANKELDMKIKEMGITSVDIAEIKKRAYTAGETLNEWELNFLAKVQAIEIADVKSEIDKYNANFAAKAGIQVGEKQNTILQISNSLLKKLGL